MKCKLCGSKINKFDIIQLSGHILAIMISQKLSQEAKLSELLDYFTFGEESIVEKFKVPQEFIDR